MASKSTAVLVGTTVTRLDTAARFLVSGNASLAIYNNGAGVVYVGGPDVTTATGVPVPAGTWSPSLDLTTGESVWGISASGSNEARVLEVGVVGVEDPYVTLSELRALPNLSDVAKFTDAELETARDWFETKFEEYTDVAWVPRTTEEWIDGTGTRCVLLRHQMVRAVSSVRVYSTAAVYAAFTATELDDLRTTPTGMVRRFGLGSFAAGSQNILVEYEHGYDRPPADVVEAAKVAIREHLLDAQSGNRVERSFGITTGEGGVIRNVLPGTDRPFGMPAVDEVANARSQKAPGIG